MLGECRSPQRLVRNSAPGKRKTFKVVLTHLLILCPPKSKPNKVFFPTSAGEFFPGTRNQVLVSFHGARQFDLQLIEIPAPPALPSMETVRALVIRATDADAC